MILVLQGRVAGARGVRCSHAREGAGIRCSCLEFVADHEFVTVPCAFWFAEIWAGCAGREEEAVQLHRCVHFSSRMLSLQPSHVVGCCIIQIIKCMADSRDSLKLQSVLSCGNPTIRLFCVELHFVLIVFYVGSLNWMNGF